MPIRLDSHSADFAERFRGFLAAKREASADVEQTVRAHHRRRGRARRRGADRADRANSTGSISTKAGLRVSAAEIDARREGLRPAGARRAQARARPDRGLSPPAKPKDERFTDALGVELGCALDRDRSGRALRAGRHRGLSVLGADERRAGQGRRRAAPGDGGAGAGRQAQLRWCWRRPSSPASTRSIASAARRRWRRSPTAPRRSRRSPRSSAPATPMSPPPSAWCSARSAST